MMEDEFRKRFDADRRQNTLTWIYDETSTAKAIALGLDGPEVIIGRDHRGEVRIAMANARFVDALA